MKQSGAGAITGSLISSILSFLPLSCCVFPVAFSFLGAGGLAFAMSLMPYRSYFVALSLLFLGGGFYFAYRPDRIWPLFARKLPPGNKCGTAAGSVRMETQRFPRD